MKMYTRKSWASWFYEVALNNKFDNDPAFGCNRPQWWGLIPVNEKETNAE